MGQDPRCGWAASGGGCLPRDRWKGAFAVAALKHGEELPSSISRGTQPLSGTGRTKPSTAPGYVLTSPKSLIPPLWLHPLKRAGTRLALGWHWAGTRPRRAARSRAQCRVSGRRSREMQSRWCYFSIFAPVGFGIFLSLFAALVVFFSSLIFFFLFLF